MSQWIPPLVHAVPDINKLRKYHYLPVAETPITNTDDSKRREVEDYRSRSKRVHQKNEINIEESASVQTFCNRYIVKKSLVKKIPRSFKSFRDDELANFTPIARMGHLISEPNFRSSLLSTHFGEEKRRPEIRLWSQARKQQGSLEEYWTWDKSHQQKDFVI